MTIGSGVVSSLARLYFQSATKYVISRISYCSCARSLRSGPAALNVAQNSAAEIKWMPRISLTLSSSLETTALVFLRHKG
jgi:hypothetical protein